MTNTTAHSLTILTGTALMGFATLALTACQIAPATASAQTSNTAAEGAPPQKGAPPTGSDSENAGTASPSTTPPRSALIGMANPASVHCVNAGGKLEIRTSTSGGQYGVCHLPDGSKCEEWSFFRTGQCKAETLKNR